jgi:hypothetical protein
MVFPPFEFQKSHTGKIRGLDIEALSFYGGPTGDVLKRNPSPPPQILICTNEVDPEVL